MKKLNNDIENIAVKIRAVLKGNLQITFHEEKNQLLHEFEKLLDDWLANYQEVLLFNASLLIDMKSFLQQYPDSNNRNKDYERIKNRVLEMESLLKQFK